MWLLSSAWLYEKDKVNELLKDGYEPFSTVKLKTHNGNKIKMYFRKLEMQELTMTVEQTEPRTMEVKIEVDRTQLDKFIGDFESFMEEMTIKIEKIVEAIREPEMPEWVKKNITQISDVGSHIDLVLSPQSIDDLTDKSSNKDFEDDGIQEEDSPEREQEPPAGDAYRVVDEIPQEVQEQMSSGVKTPAQVQAIEDIKKSNSTNITVYPVRKDGVVIVTCGNKEYEIGKNGDTDETVTKAKTSSVGGV